MRVMVIVKATKESEAENNPFDVEGAAEMFEAMGKFNEELVKAGIMLAGDGLKPSKFGKRVHFNGTKRSVTDGPFAETKELVAGYWIWQVRSMDEAIEWAKRCPNPMPGPSDLEIRPLWESTDFGPEIAAQENELRAKISKTHEVSRGAPSSSLAPSPPMLALGGRLGPRPVNVGVRRSRPDDRATTEGRHHGLPC